MILLISDNPVVFVSGGEGGGGVLSLLRDLPSAVAKILKHPVIHLGLVNMPYCPEDAPENFSVDTLGALPSEYSSLQCTGKFLAWVYEQKPIALLLNDVSQINEGWRFIPPETSLIVVLHDEGNRYTSKLIENAEIIDHCIVVAEYLSQLLGRFNSKLYNQITVIHNGVLFPVDSLPNHKRDDKVREIKILYYGGIDWLKKGVQDLPRLAKCLRRKNVPFKLVIAGGVDPHLTEKFRQNNTEQFVEWRGRLEKNQCLKLASKCDVFFLPSRVEPFGLVTVESMGMGCVPIAYDIESGSRDIIVHGVNGYLAQLANVRQVADFIKVLYDSPDLKNSMRALAIQTAREQFSLENSAMKYAACISNVLTLPNKNRNKILSYECAGFAQDSVSKNVTFNRKMSSFLRKLVCSYPQLVQPFWRRFS